MIKLYPIKQRGGDKTNHDIIKLAFWYFIDELEISDHDASVIVSLCKLKDEYAYIAPTTTFRDYHQQFNINLKRDMSINDQLYYLGHECIHLQQYLCGDLIDIGENYSIWKGQDIYAQPNGASHTTVYREKHHITGHRGLEVEYIEESHAPWEDVAYGQQDELYEGLMNYLSNIDTSLRQIK